MSRPQIENIRGLPDFLTVYNWNVSITKPPAGVSIPQNFNFQCKTSSLPTASNNPIEVDIRGHKTRQAGIQSYDGTLDLQLVETVDTALFNFVRDWRETQWATGTGVALARNDSSCDFQLQLMSRQDQVVKTYTLIGGILTGYQLGDLSGDSSEALRPSITVTYDYFKES